MNDDVADNRNGQGSSFDGIPLRSYYRAVPILLGIASSPYESDALPLSPSPLQPFLRRTVGLVGLFLTIMGRTFTEAAPAIAIV